MWSDAPNGRSLQSFLTNVTPTLSGTRPPAHFALYELLTQICQKWLGVRVPLSVGITFVKNDCNDLPSGASDPV